MQCKDVRNQFADYLSGALSGSVRADVEKHRTQSATAHDSEDQPGCGADQDELRGAANDQPQDIATLRAEGHPHSHLVGPLHNQE